MLARQFSKAVQQLGGQAPRSTTWGERSAFSSYCYDVLHVPVNATYVSARKMRWSWNAGKINL